jgi:hypothetical protein
MDESRNYSGGVRNEVYQLQSVVEQKDEKEISRREVEVTLPTTPPDGYLSCLM